MGFKVRRAPLRATSTSETYRYISAEDGALDEERCDFAEYHATLDEGHLAFLPEMEPARFECVPLTRAQLNVARRKAMANATDDDGELSPVAFRNCLAEQCFARGVKKVSGVTLVDAAGVESKRTLKAAELVDLLPLEVVLEVGFFLLIKTDGLLDPTPETDVGKS